MQQHAIAPAVVLRGEGAWQEAMPGLQALSRRPLLLGRSSATRSLREQLSADLRRRDLAVTMAELEHDCCESDLAQISQILSSSGCDAVVAAGGGNDQADGGDGDDTLRMLTNVDVMANVDLAALIGEFVPDLNWAGFYRMVDGALVLGPFVGKPACIRIAMGQGVCGAAAQSGQTQLVPDVHAFPGHIACDDASRSELVVPVLRDGVVVAVIDLDSPSLARFDDDDARGIEVLAAAIAARI